MTIDQGEKWLEEVYRGVKLEHPELVRRLGVTLLLLAQLRFSASPTLSSGSSNKM